MDAIKRETTRDIGRRYRQVRALTEAICRPLQVEDYVVQPREWVSPPKWHLAHTAWFFETFLLVPHMPGYRPFDSHYGFLFNSYYEAIGVRADKARRGTYSRPTVEEVYRYRHLVDMAMEHLVSSGLGPEGMESLVELGLHHEQQHQELLLADIKAILYANPGRPAYAPAGTASLSASFSPFFSASIPASADGWAGASAGSAGGGGWLDFRGGVKEMGWDGEGFAYDNERPRHKVHLGDYRMGETVVSNRRYLGFVEDGGYSRPEFWLSDGWRTVREEGWEAPLYWERTEGNGWREFTERGMEPLDPDAPVRHVSYYEADAFARWCGSRLPTEAEWENAAEKLRDRGEVWEWTASAYLPYPGFRPFAGAVGEYNGKFMVDQMVLRGGSRATPEGHLRVTYRNFYPASHRWQFGGIRLAEGP